MWKPRPFHQLTNLHNKNVYDDDDKKATETPFCSFPFSLLCQSTLGRGDQRKRRLCECYTAELVHGIPLKLYCYSLSMLRVWFSLPASSSWPHSCWCCYSSLTRFEPEMVEKLHLSRGLNRLSWFFFFFLLSHTSLVRVLLGVSCLYSRPPCSPVFYIKFRNRAEEFPQASPLFSEVLLLRSKLLSSVAFLCCVMFPVQSYESGTPCLPVCSSCHLHPRRCSELCGV